MGLREVKLCAKALWPTLDVNNVYFLRFESHSDRMTITYLTGRGERCYANIPMPLMTTEGAAMAWYPEYRMVVYCE